ncbi:siphovirus Gp157 family protein [Exiguobacterium sp. AB2]|uniref:siphovirus Gp157 family protein n=1 Tax=Exiguobacterium sp. AB2 TaxID=1484479 RepID=UPI0004A8E4C9|nr:siphovirus Gp157 family protein [Exiguobacterium sp. AB2]KDN58477.1 hypothetical protein DI14_04915 [Exiguobacterium sp. AB2]
MKLYELTSKRQELLDLIAAMDSEDLELSDAVGDTLEALDEAIQDKAEAVASFIFSLQADSAALKQEEQRLAERRRLNDAKVERMKTYLADMLEDADIDRINGLKYTIGFRKSEKVAVTNLDALPECFLRIKREPNLTALKEALKAGQAFDGVSLTTNKNLSIR